MPATANVGAGASVSISATLPTTFDDHVSTGYPSLSFTTIAGVTDYTPGGQEWGETTSQPINQDYPNIYKSVYDFGSDSVTMDRDDDDAGQVIVLAALASRNDYAIRVTWDDGSDDYYTAKVMSFNDGAVTAEGMVTKIANLRRTRVVVSVV